jgi:uncharacterized membrane protein required for colicin V production
MTLIDVILLVLLGGFIMFGAWFGLMHTLGSLVGTVIGALIAGWLHIPLGTWAQGIFGGGEWTMVITYAVIFMVISRLVGFGFYILDKSFGIVTNLPYLKQADRIVGAVIGFFEGVLVIGLALFVASRYDLGDTFMLALAGSDVAAWFVSSSQILQPLFPKAFKELRSVIGI